METIIKKTETPSDKHIVLHLNDSLTIEGIKELQSGINAHLGKVDEIEIHAGKVKNMDLTALQLLYSLKVKAENDNKKLHFHIQAEPLTADLVKLSGFNDILNLFK